MPYKKKPVNKLFKNYGIETAIHYEIPIHKTKVYKSKLKLSNSERNGKQLISLPMHPFCQKGYHYITSKINKFYKSKKTLISVHFHSGETRGIKICIYPFLNK